MIEIETVSNLGGITVETQQYRGHPPEYWAERATERICGISENAEGHVKQQAEAFKVAIYNTILYYIKAGINSERCTMRNLLEQQGHKDLAKILTELK
jgi:hypothetical protein|tara:strand:+ start:15058 stop:15351 length:294 start_codon:yes stop_codon:yes gene_type:complete